MAREGDRLVFSIPRQPAAGKVSYHITLWDDSGHKYPLTGEPIIIRFKDPVPATLLIPHIIIIFAAMLFSMRTGIEAFLKRGNLPLLAFWTAVLMFIGGLIFGPLVQKYAFGAFYTGWPSGHDLTDTKTAIAFLLWLVAALYPSKRPAKRAWAIAACLITVIVFLVPHSLLGSELDHMRSQ